MVFDPMQLRYSFPETDQAHYKGKKIEVCWKLLIAKTELWCIQIMVVYISIPSGPDNDI